MDSGSENAAILSRSEGMTVLMLVCGSRVIIRLRDEAPTGTALDVTTSVRSSGTGVPPFLLFIPFEDTSQRSDVRVGVAITANPLARRYPL